MRKCCTSIYFNVLVLTVLGLFPILVYGQLDADLTTTDNTNCDGVACDYSGPSIIINELMMSPNSNDGSMWGSNTSQRGEWIELYNPNICDPIDISCFYLGNNANDSDPYPGGYVIPPGTVVPPAGFALIRGLNAPAVPANRLLANGGNVVELVVDGTGVCIGGGSRLWFPNSGGWFAFYDNNGVPQDAVSWANQSNLGNSPCVPALAGCGFTGSLSNYNNFPNDRKNYILNQSAANFQGQSIRRLPDGGTWSGPGTPTFANCNAACSDPSNSCNGTALATVSPIGGTPPYTYFWDDPQGQITPTAYNLCAGEYCVTITDALNNATVQCITVENATYDMVINAAICESESYTLPNDSVVTAAGYYPILLQTENGCDSTINVILQVHPEYAFELNPQICQNQTYTLPDGSDVGVSGTYIVDLQTIHGCDSTYTVNLTVSSPIEITVDAQICAGDTYELPDGVEVTNPGTYQVLVDGDPAYCDTLFSVNLDFYPSHQVNFAGLSDVSCFGDTDGGLNLQVTGPGSPFTFVWSDGIDHGSEATDLEPGNYSVEVSSLNGCAIDTSFQINEPPPVSISASASVLICLGSSSQLIAAAAGGTGNFNYTWNHTTSTDPITLVTPQQDTTYSVFATDANGCGTDTIVMNLSVINMYSDSLTVSAGDSICAGEEASVSASYNGKYPPYTYTWNNGLPDGPGPFTVSPNSTTTYTVTVRDDCGNEVSNDVEIVVWSLPVVAPLNVSNISCNGEGDGMAEIGVTQGTPDYSFVWSDGEDHGAQATDLESGTYTVVVMDANGCSSDTSFQIIEPDPVSLTASADALICVNSPTQLSAAAGGGTGDFDYNWNHTTSTDSLSTVSPLQDTTYTVHATDVNGCSTDTLSINVAVINMYADSLEVSADDSVCYGGEVTLFANYSGQYPPYTYTWNNGLPDGPGPVTVSPETTTTYTVTVSDDCGNQVSKDIEIIIWALPVVTSNNVTNVSCNGANDGSADIEVGSGLPAYNYEWTDGQDYGANATGLPPGNYGVDITDANGCETSTTFSITEPQPISFALEADTLLCFGESTDLITTIDGGTPDYTYHWGHTTVSSPTVTVSPPETTIYSVYAEDVNGCISPALAISVLVSTNLDPGLLMISDDVTICPGESTALSASYAGSFPPYQYIWSDNLPEGQGPHIVTPDSATTYSLTIIDYCGTALNADVTVDLYENPTAEVPDLLIAGCSPLEVSLFDPINTEPGYSHEWRLDDGSSYSGNPVDFTLEEAGVFQVTLIVTSPDGCSAISENTLPVEVYPLPNAAMSASAWTTGMDQPQVTFADVSTGSIFSTWTIENTTFENQSELTYTFPDTGYYAIQLMVENEFGCRDSITRTVTITIDKTIEIPNAFTPGGSGGNPYYDPTSTSNTVFYPFFEYVVEYEMSVFNRWGELIFESTEKEKGWNGTYRDKPCPQDVYVYKVNLVFADGSKATRVGDVTLFR